MNPAIVWLTGLSGCGKTTIARGLEAALAAEGHRVCLLDGDELRRGLSADLGFSAADRAENMRRACEVALLLARRGVTVIVALISPLHRERQRARQRAVETGVGFIEVFLDCPAEICERRDPKGLYKRARAGELADFTGVSAIYEPPENADLVLATGSETASQSAARIVAFLRDRPERLPKGLSG